MAIELRHSARTAERSEPTDPSQTGPRARLSEPPALERPSERPSADRLSSAPSRRSRVTRPSMRPSAFGMPRTSAPPGPELDDAPLRTTGSSSKPAKRESLPPHNTHLRARADESRVASESPGVSQTQPVKKRARATSPLSAHAPEGAFRPPAVKTDIEELLPISQGVKSLPRPPRLPSFEPSQVPQAAPRRFPWASLAVFAVMLAASLAPLFHYRGEGKQAVPQAEPLVARVDPLLGVPVLGVSVEPVPAGSSAVGSAPSAVQRIERAFWGQPARVHQALLEEGERALRADDERLAETLFARARDFDGDDAQSAFGLARVRLAQGDLEGAEGWVLLAIRQHPRRAEYRALHAEVLQRLGRGPEAQLERSLGRSLPHATPHFPAETRSR